MDMTHPCEARRVAFSQLTSEQTGHRLHKNWNKTLDRTSLTSTQDKELVNKVSSSSFPTLGSSTRTGPITEEKSKTNSSKIQRTLFCGGVPVSASFHSWTVTGLYLDAMSIKKNMSPVSHCFLKSIMGGYGLLDTLGFSTQHRVNSPHINHNIHILKKWFFLLNFYAICIYKNPSAWD